MPVYSQQNHWQKSQNIKETFTKYEMAEKQVAGTSTVTETSSQNEVRD